MKKLDRLEKLSQTGPPWFSHEIRTVGESLPGLLAVARLATCPACGVQGSFTWDGPTACPHAYHTAMAALDVEVVP